MPTASASQATRPAGSDESPGERTTPRYRRSPVRRLRCLLLLRGEPLAGALEYVQLVREVLSSDRYEIPDVEPAPGYNLLQLNDTGGASATAFAPAFAVWIALSFNLLNNRLPAFICAGEAFRLMISKVTFI